MKPKIEHFMEEADIGSGEKTPAELADQKDTEHLREQQEQARQQQHSLDGGSLLQVTEEQQYIAQHESHTPPEEGQAAQQVDAAAPAAGEKSSDSQTEALEVPSPAVTAKKSRHTHARHEGGRSGRAG